MVPVCDPYQRIGPAWPYRNRASWPLIESATGIDQAALRALKQRLETSSTTTEPTEGSANGAEDTE